MSDDENFAPKPIDVAAHTDPASVPDEQRTSVDPRAARVDAARKAAEIPTNDTPTQTFDEFANPASAVIVQELQDIRGEMTTYGAVVLGAVWLSGLAVGYVAFRFYRSEYCPTPVEDGANDER